MPNIAITTRDVARELARRYSTMTHEELDLLESILVPMKFAKNEMVLKEGETCTNIYWVVKGLVRQFYYKNEKELTEYMATENSIVMCIESLFHEVPTYLQIKAIEFTVLIAMPKADLEAVAMKSVNIQILYRMILEESLILSQHHADMLRFESAQDRYQKLVKNQLLFDDHLKSRVHPLRCHLSQPGRLWHLLLSHRHRGDRKRKAH